MVTLLLSKSTPQRVDETTLLAWVFPSVVEVLSRADVPVEYGESE
jgi:hypothetical protein